MDVVITPAGIVRCIYDETLDLSPLGLMDIRRASHVEPTAGGQWQADLSPVCGPVLGPYAKRSDAIEAELSWLRVNWIGVSS